MDPVNTGLITDTHSNLNFEGKNATFKLQVTNKMPILKKNVCMYVCMYVCMLIWASLLGAAGHPGSLQQEAGSVFRNLL
jgi:hypothetical protein